MAYLGAFTTGDPDQIVRWVTDDFVNDHTSAMGESFSGKEQYRERLPRFLDNMPGLFYDIEHTITEGDRVAIAYVLRSRPRGRFIALRGAMHFEVRDGLIAKRTDYWDALTFRQQAGLD